MTAPSVLGEVPTQILPTTELISTVSRATTVRVTWILAASGLKFIVSFAVASSPRMHGPVVPADRASARAEQQRAAVRAL